MTVLYRVKANLRPKACCTVQRRRFVYLKEDGFAHPHKYYFSLKILERVTELIQSETVQKNLLASVVLCLAELVSALRAHAIGTLNQFMPAIIKVLHAQKELET
jgi:hypothetical protein